MAGPVVVDYGDGGNFGTGRSRGYLGVRLLSGIGARGRREAITRVNTSHEQGKAVRDVDGWFCIPQLPGIVRQGQ